MIGKRPTFINVANRARVRTLGDSVRQSFQRATTAALSLVFPPICAYCENPLDVGSIEPQLCLSCRNQVFTSAVAGCPRCSAYGMKVNEIDGTCPECVGEKFAFERVFSLGPYVGEIQAAVLRMKYGGGEPLAMAVGNRLGEHIDCMNRDDKPDVLTCIPKYWLKQLATGVNSAETIMYGLGKRAKVYAAPDLLACKRRIKKQSMLSPQQRRRNVSGAWSVNESFEITDLHVMIVDDTMTTGATANEAAKALKRAGARKVTLAVVARAAKPQ